jgi:hypothetical protein
MADVAALEAAIYEQSFRALDEQARVLDALRARAGALVASATVATAFLGALAGVSVDRRAHLDWASWLAIALYIAVLLLSLVVTTPRASSVFSHHPHRLLSAYLENGRSATIGGYRRAIAHYNGRHFDANARQLRLLDRMLMLASVLLGLELVLWLWVIAT